MDCHTILLKQYLNADFLSVSYDGENSANVYLSSSYSRLTCGLCGSHDQDDTNDMVMPNGNIVSIKKKKIQPKRHVPRWQAAAN